MSIRDRKYIRLTIPARHITKSANDGGTNDMIRKFIDQSFKISLGRSSWVQPIIIDCTPEQYAHFCMLIQNENWTLYDAKAEYLNELTHHFSAIGN